jgi:hypothetical protein
MDGERKVSGDYGVKQESWPKAAFGIREGLIARAHQARSRIVFR